jgi:protocatechuate 3,4-dioxygenase beta subunit
MVPPALGGLWQVSCGGDDEAPGPTQTPSSTPGGVPASEPAAAAATSVPPAATAQVQQLAPTPACGDDDEPTVAQTEGPYFTPDSPERVSLLEPGMAGTVMVLRGHVLSTRCEPIEGALIDFWQADDAGVYDNTGFTLRGHQFTEASGAYELETIIPGLYPGRTRHIHVKVQAPNQPVLTTQLYFSDEPQNATDGIFHASLVMDLAGTDGRFDFVLDV